MEAALPDRVADDGRRFPVVREPASRGWPEPQHVRVVGGRDFRDHEAALAVRVEVGLHRKRHGETRQHTGARLDLSIVGIRPGRVDAPADEDQAVGPGDRHRPQHDRIDYAEDGRVDADAEPEAEHREHRKTRSAPELPERMAQVAAKILDEADAACVAVLLLDLIEPAELDARPAHGLVPRNPVPHVRFDQALEMEPELVVQLPFDGVAFEEGPETEEPVGQHRALPLQLQPFQHLGDGIAQLAPRRDLDLQPRAPAPGELVGTSRGGCCRMCPSAP